MEWSLINRMHQNNQLRPCPKCCTAIKFKVRGDGLIVAPGVDIDGYSFLLYAGEIDRRLTMNFSAALGNTMEGFSFLSCESAAIQSITVILAGGIRSLEVKSGTNNCLGFQLCCQIPEGTVIPLLRHVIGQLDFDVILRSNRYPEKQPSCSSSSVSKVWS